MTEVPARAVRRQFLDGSFALVMLAVAVVSGYTILGSPAVLRAKVPGEPVALHAPGSDAESAASPASHPTDDLVPDSPAPVDPAQPVAPAPPPAVKVPTIAVSGRVLGSGGAPLAGASIVFGGAEFRTDAEGRFNLDTAPADAELLVKMPGFERARVRPVQGKVEVTLRPQLVKAAYLTYFGIADKGIRGRVMELIARTELNAVVVDVKGDRGWIPYRTDVPLARAAGAQGPVILRDIDGMIADLKARGAYTVARIVCFKDNVLATHRPDWAVMDTRTGKPWTDRENLAWVDPFREEVWDYNIAIAKEAIAKGFDEVQFDYVRFPTDGKLAAARYSKPVNKDTRLPTIAAFLARARRELGPLGAFVAADIFGYTAFNENDTDIGQRIEELAPHVDYFSPMVYPSGYHLGIPGYRNPVTNPYQVVFESVRLIRKRSTHATVVVRPWLQDFRDYAFDRRMFGAAEVRAQIKGAEEAGAGGWMLWNPRNAYTAEALRAKSELVAK